MGFTQYWECKRGLDTEKFKAYVKDVKKVLEGVDIICHENDMPETPPTIKDDLIRFNGKGEDGHETFMITPEPSDFEFCKTARKPYDKYVVACLILAKFHFGDAIEISSDGDLEDWEDGLCLAQDKTGIILDISFDEEGNLKLV